MELSQMISMILKLFHQTLLGMKYNHYLVSFHLDHSNIKTTPFCKE